MKNRPVCTAPALNADSPVPAPDSVPDSGSVPAIPSGYKINSVGLLTPEGKEPRHVLVDEKSLIGVRFRMWNRTPVGGYRTLDVPWGKINEFEQESPPREGVLALLKACVERQLDESEGCYYEGYDEQGGLFDDAFYRLVQEYHSRLTPETIVDDLFEHAFGRRPSVCALFGIRWREGSSALKRIRYLCKASPERVRVMMDYAMRFDLENRSHQRVFLEIWAANFRALRKWRFKIVKKIASYLTWSEIVHVLSQYTDDEAFVGWSDAWMFAATKRLDHQEDADKGIEWMEELVTALCRGRWTPLRREQWLHLPNLAKLARLWGFTPEDFLDKCSLPPAL